MRVALEILTWIAQAAVWSMVVLIVAFVIAYAPSFFRSPSSLGRTVLGGKLALFLLVFSSLVGLFLHRSLLVGILQFIAIISILVWLIYDYIILRHIQNRGKRLPWWRKILPFNNYYK